MEKSLEQIYSEFGEDLKKIAENVIGDIIAQYIPYAELDLEMNVYARSKELLRCFLTDTQPNEWMSKSDIFQSFNSAEVRFKIFDEFKDQIISSLSEDLVNENDRLRAENDLLRKDLEEYKRYVTL